MAKSKVPNIQATVNNAWAELRSVDENKRSIAKTISAGDLKKAWDKVTENEPWVSNTLLDKLINELKLYPLVKGK
jgi:hypothetical protein